MKYTNYRKNYKKTSRTLKKVVLLLAFFSVLPSSVFASDFSSINNDLQTLENLLNDTLANTTEQQRLLDDLRNNLTTSGNLISSYESIINGQENLLRDLQTQLTAMSETFRTQSALSARYERNSKFWRTFTLAAVPLTALISGGIVWAVVK